MSERCEGLRTGGPVPAGGAHAAGAGRRLHVLVVDDDADFGEALVLLLEACGHAAVLETSGLAALGRLRALPPPDVVLCDVGLPDIDGRDVADELRTNRAFPRVAIALMSAVGAPASACGSPLGVTAKPRGSADVTAFLDALWALLPPARAGVQEA